MAVCGFSYPMTVLNECKDNQEATDGKKPRLLEGQDHIKCSKEKRSLKRGFDIDNLELHKVEPCGEPSFGFGAQECVNYMWYDDRLKSYWTWPKAHPMKPESLAVAGMYYTGSTDKVKCPWCRIALSQWEVNDDPLGEQWKHSKGDCTFLRVYFPSKASQ